MFITALCPTYRHPQLLANSLELWNRQDYPKDKRFMLILDDDDTFDTQDLDGGILYSQKERVPSLPEKYNKMLLLAPKETEAFVVWEDDDIYLPGYVSAHARVLAEHELSKPKIVLSDYTRRIAAEGAEGRFHSTIAFRKSLIDRIGGWPLTLKANFDQQLLAALYGNATSNGNPWATAKDTQFIYSWHTGAAHCQSTMDSPDDETWYARGEQAYAKVARVGKLEPVLDTRTKQLLKELRFYSSR